MSLQNTRSGLPGNKTDRRNGKPQTESQRFAAVENFALFVLAGVKSQISNQRAAEIISKSTRDVICLVCDREIKRIKKAQELRKELKRG
jgi:hypothetical protein